MNSGTERLRSEVDGSYRGEAKCVKPDRDDQEVKAQSVLEKKIAHIFRADIPFQE